MANTIKEKQTSQYISVHRISSTQLTDDDLTGNSIELDGETYLELMPEVKRRHKIRSLYNHETDERILIVK
jgi:hypothetical protein